MGVWLIRAGKHGEYEQKFLEESRVYVTWGGLDVDVGGMEERQELTGAMTSRYPDQKPKAIMNWGRSFEVWGKRGALRFVEWLQGERAKGTSSKLLPSAPVVPKGALGAALRALRGAQ